jgi:hypothetical protein
VFATVSAQALPATAMIDLLIMWSLVSAQTGVEAITTTWTSRAQRVSDRFAENVVKMDPAIDRTT